MAKYSVSQVADIIDEESIGAALTNIEVKNIKDADLADLWERAQEAINEVTSYVEDNRDSVDDSEVADPDGSDDDWN
jgi:hypothetical protein